MAEKLNQSALKALRVLECLFEDDFGGKSLEAVAEATGIPWSTAWRLLKTLEVAGWAVETPVASSKQGRWMVSSRLMGIAHAHERHAVAQVQGIKKEFHRVTGKELKA